MPDITATRPVSGQPIETAWGDQVHDALEGIQSGTVALVAPGSSAAPSVTVVFPRAYATPPVVFVSPLTGGGAQQPFIQAPTASQVVIGVANNTGTGNVAAATYQLQWLAVGVPA